MLEDGVDGIGENLIIQASGHGEDLSIFPEGNDNLLMNFQHRRKIL